MVQFQGGPGGATINARGTISGGTGALRASRDIIMFDQGGTGFSNELCWPIDVLAVNPETHDEEKAAAETRIDEAGLSAFSDPDDVYAAMPDYRSPEDHGRCLPLFAEQGIDLEHYSTASTVRDSIAVTEHLGYPFCHLFGGSHGTSVVLAILGHHTEMGDSDPPDIEFHERRQEYGYVIIGSARGLLHHPVGHYPISLGLYEIPNSSRSLKQARNASRSGPRWRWVSRACHPARNVLLHPASTETSVLRIACLRVQVTSARASTTLESCGARQRRWYTLPRRSTPFTQSPISPMGDAPRSATHGALGFRRSVG